MFGLNKKRKSAIQAEIDELKERATQLTEEANRLTENEFEQLKFLIKNYIRLRFERPNFYSPEDPSIFLKNMKEAREEIIQHCVHILCDDYNWLTRDRLKEKIPKLIEIILMATGG